MPENEQLVIIVGEWVQKAENDLTTAAHVLKMGSVCPTDSVCFHAQQCVEKYVKALLVLKRLDFPRTHDLERLVSLLPRNCKLPIHAEERSQLTDYAAGARYPGWDVISLSEARRAVAIARRVRKEARRLVPREAKRRKPNC